MGRKAVLIILLLLAAIFISLGYQALHINNGQVALPPQTINLAVANLIDSSPVYIALSKGYFRDEGVEAKVFEYSSGKDALAAVIEKKADFATVADTPVMFSGFSGEKPKIIATICTSDKDLAIVARKDRGVAKPEDLRGKKIGVYSGTKQEFFLDTFLLFNKIHRKEVVTIELKPEEMVEALLSGKVDAVSAWNPIIVMLQRELKNNNVTFYAEGIYTSFWNVAATEGLTVKNREVVIRVIKALLKAEKFIKTNPDESLAVIARSIKLDEGLIIDQWKLYRFEVALDQSLLITLDDQARWAIAKGYTDRKTMPNYLEMVYAEGLQEIRPEAMTLIR